MVTNKLTSGTLADADAVNEISGVISIEAGENISSGNIVYFHLTNGKAYVSDTGTTDDIRANGIALTTVSTGSDVVVLTRGVYTTTGLTEAVSYYLGAAGAYSATMSGVKIGHALSTTQLFVNIVQDDRDVVGTIKPIAISIAGMPSNYLTAFWKACAGATLTDAESPLNGVALPNLNSTQRFLRGKATSGTTGGSDTHNHTVSVTSHVNNGTGAEGFTSGTTDVNTSTSSTLPAYYEVPFYIKVK